MVAMETLARNVFKPLELIVNYTFLQYLAILYWARLKERRVQLLLLIGMTSVVCMVPFASDDPSQVEHLNHISESSCVVTFLIQITILGYDLNKKVKFKSILYFTHVAELLIAIGLVTIGVSIVATFWPDHLSDTIQDKLPTVVEEVILVFVFVFRLYCMVVISSWRELLRTKRLEIVCYLAFTFHELPFRILEAATGSSWEAVQSLFHRVTIALCLWVTVSSKMRGGSRSSVVSHRGSGAPPMGPTVKRSSLTGSTARIESFQKKYMRRGSSAAVVFATLQVERKRSTGMQEDQPRAEV